MALTFNGQKPIVLLAFSVVLLALSACSEQEQASSVFIKADPAVDSVMDYPPRTLRVFLTQLPDVENSSLQLFGPEGEVSLRGFHTMGADDLMIEIEDYPLPNGQYTVNWTAVFVDGEEEHSGSYQFTVAVAE